MKQIFFYVLVLSFCNCTLLRIEKNRYKLEMVSIKNELFLFGDFYNGKNPDATPAHMVYVDDFKIGKYEVTYEQFDYFAVKTGIEKPHSDIEDRVLRAVTYVTWGEAKAFCNFFGYRLPTEVEWVYAARSRGKEHVLSGTASLDSIYVVALTKHENRSESVIVGTKKTNDLGIYDMSGNAFEWIGEYYQSIQNLRKNTVWTKMRFELFEGGVFMKILLQIVPIGELGL